MDWAAAYDTEIRGLVSVNFNIFSNLAYYFYFLFRKDRNDRKGGPERPIFIPRIASQFEQEATLTFGVYIEKLIS